MPTTEQWLEFKKAEGIHEVTAGPDLITHAAPPNGYERVRARTHRSRLMFKPPIEDLSGLVDKVGRGRQKQVRDSWKNLSGAERARRVQKLKENGMAMGRKVVA